MKTETTNLPSLKLVLSKYHTMLLEKDKELQNCEVIVLAKEKELQDRDIRIKKLLQDNSYLQEQVSYFKSLKFYPKSERLRDKSEGLQIELFNEAELLFDSAVKKEEEDSEEKALIDIPAHKRKKRGKRRKLPEYLPREEVVIDLPEEEKQCSKDGKELTCIGEDISEKLEIIPARMKVIRTIKKKYVCKTCSDGVRSSPTPLSLFPKGFATPSLIAHIVTSKYVDGIPLYRLERVMRRYGIDISRVTMSRWMIEVAEKLAPLVEILREELLSSPYIHCDETTVQVLKEAGKKATTKSYMWVQGRSGKHPIILFDYDPTRSAEVPKRLFKGYKGYLHTDGYSGYKWIEGEDGIERLGCMSHCRRYFYNAYSHTGSKEIGLQGLRFINPLFEIERKIDGKEFSEKKEIRQQESKPILEEMKEWLDEQEGKHLPKGYMGKAINYALGEWKYLIKYLEDGQLHICNNFIERSIRPFVIGRKNWLFCITPSGAKASAILYSLVETAKANNKEPFEYLQRILTDIPKAESLTDYMKLLPFDVDSE